MAEVVIYTRMFCGFCTAAVRLLQQKGVELEKIDATMNPKLRAEMIKRAGGRNTYPQIFIGGRHIGGCEELYALEDSGELDRLIAQQI